MSAPSGSSMLWMFLLKMQTKPVCEGRRLNAVKHQGGRKADGLNRFKSQQI